MQQEINVKEQLMRKLSNTLEGMKKQRAIRMATLAQSRAGQFTSMNESQNINDITQDVSNDNLIYSTN